MKDTKTPDYYNAGGISSHDAIKAKVTREQYQGWHLCAVQSYLDRFNFKHPTTRGKLEEIEKCLVHLTWLRNSLVEEIEEEENARAAHAALKLEM